MSISYLSAIPENNKSSYSEYDTVDFMMTYENQSLVMGSVRLEGEVSVTHNGLPLNNVANKALDIKYDRQVGAHSFIESIQTEVLSEVIENIVEYPRMIKQYSSARDNQGDMFNSSRVCELKAPQDSMTTVMLQGEEPPAQNANPLRENPDFSIKLDFVLNSVDEELLPYGRTGAIRVSVNLARLNSCLYGNSVDGNTRYTLHGLRLVYKATKDMPEDMNAPVVVRKRQSIKQSIQTGLANVQAQVPSANVEAFSASFQVQSKENTAKNNNLDLEKVPDLQELQFLFNDSTNQAITYLMRSNSEVLYHFVDALGFTGRNQLAVANMDSNEGYGIGYKFDSPISLMNQKLSVQINSAISNSRPLVIYMFFHSVMEL
jgi:hypothetical protein